MNYTGSQILLPIGQEWSLVSAGDPEIAASDPRKYRWQRQLAQVVLGEDVGTEGDWISPQLLIDTPIFTTYPQNSA